ncbi:hypothetical protein HY04AAS1_0733 [Hydrogenobaculum sp. Y04AAS1]|uniref:hypothetical protein n=1 Tax=Hydrogenobaculum sp. (strain Y04AAS1) TaxID=380749 RepID=UPI00015BE3E2|nr:hypothetical protein HY04AAS1_0733 [Hydrogenobaculum sp. Y04AAS1]HCT65961.1 hypothetical protein [Hydrogenobaculum sp.]
MEEKIFVKGKYTTIEISKNELFELLRELKERTKGTDLLEAFEIMQDFPDLDKFKVLRDIYILELSGAFKEPIQIEELYKEV